MDPRRRQSTMLGTSTRRHASSTEAYSSLNLQHSIARDDGTGKSAFGFEQTAFSFLMFEHSLGFDIAFGFWINPATIVKHSE